MITECNHTNVKICAECLRENELEQLKSDLRKLVEEVRNGPPYPRDPDKLAIWQGECNVADELDKLLRGK